MTFSAILKTTCYVLKYAADHFWQLLDKIGQLLFHHLVTSVLATISVTRLGDFQSCGQQIFSQLLPKYL